MAEVQNKKQLTIIEGLEVFNWEIQTTQDDNQADELAQAAIDTFSDDLMYEFIEKTLLFHSLSSFILKQNDKEGTLTQIRFGELFHIASCVGLSYFRTQNESCRSLCLAVDAECIAVPPEESAKYDPFMEAVKVPIDSLAAIKDIS